MNRYAEQCKSLHISSHSCPWHDVTCEEFKAFFGMLFYMGMARLPQLELYWSTKQELFRQHIADVMPLVRFQQILRFLHLNDSDKQLTVDQPRYDPLFKVRKLLGIVTPKFESEYNLSESMSIDEAMILFKGRLSFKQYMESNYLSWLMENMGI